MTKIGNVGTAALLVLFPSGHTAHKEKSIVHLRRSFLLGYIDKPIAEEKPPRKAVNTTVE